jgi:hypothetical protein
MHGERCLSERCVLVGKLYVLRFIVVRDNVTVSASGLITE